MENMVDEKEITLNAFKGKKVFITGHTGFKGSWLFYWLIQLGADVKGFALAPETDPSLFKKMFSALKINSVIGDINDLNNLKRAIIEFEPDFIFHMAAQPLVRKSYQMPVETFQTNVIGTANVLESVKFLNNPCTCIFITTDKVYENREWHYPYRESDRLGGYDPYSASKAGSELVIASYRNSFFHPDKFEDHHKIIISTRAGNVIGGGDWSKDRLIPDIIQALKESREIQIRNPFSIRPWQHVMEPLSGYMLLALTAADNISFLKPDMNAWNFGPVSEDNFSVMEVAKKAITIWGKGQIKLNIDPTAVHEAKLLKLDISKAINELIWKPKMKAEIAIERTINWYKSFYDGESAQSLVEKDLEYYRGLS